MSNLGPFRAGGQPGLPTLPQGEVIARYGTYAEAQRAVDFLSDSHFPVQFCTILGTDLRMVERVTGRLTYGRVALAGALSGAWFGLFVGLLLSLFGGGAGIGVFAAIIIGAGFGMLFGVISFAGTRGRRDFTSSSQIVAAEYEVMCVAEQSSQAVQLLERLPGGLGRGPGGGFGGPSSGTGGFGRGGGPTAPAPVAPVPPAEPGAPVPEPEVSGPTYSEMIERQRRRQQEEAEGARHGGPPE